MGAEPSEVFSKTPAINRGIPRVVHFVNCVGLTPLCFLKSPRQVSMRRRFFMLDNSGKQIYLVCRSKDMSNCKTSCSQYILLNRQ